MNFPLFTFLPCPPVSSTLLPFPVSDAGGRVRGAEIVVVVVVSRFTSSVLHEQVVVLNVVLGRCLIVGGVRRPTAARDAARPCSTLKIRILDFSDRLFMFLSPFLFLNVHAKQISYSCCATGPRVFGSAHPTLKGLWVWKDVSWRRVIQYLVCRNIEYKHVTCPREEARDAVRSREARAGAERGCGWRDGASGTLRRFWADTGGAADVGLIPCQTQKYRAFDWNLEEVISLVMRKKWIRSVGGQTTRLFWFLGWEIQ